MGGPEARAAPGALSKEHRPKVSKQPEQPGHTAQGVPSGGCAPAVGSFKKEIEAMWRRCGLRGLAEEAWGKWEVGYVSNKIQTTCPHGPLLATFNTEMISFQDPKFPRVDGSLHLRSLLFLGPTQTTVLTPSSSFHTEDRWHPEERRMVPRITPSNGGQILKSPRSIQE